MSVHGSAHVDHSSTRSQYTRAHASHSSHNDKHDDELAPPGGAAGRMSSAKGAKVSHSQAGSARRFDYDTQHRGGNTSESGASSRQAHGSARLSPRGESHKTVSVSSGRHAPAHKAGGLGGAFSPNPTASAQEMSTYSPHGPALQQDSRQKLGMIPGAIGKVGGNGAGIDGTLY